MRTVGNRICKVALITAAAAIALWAAATEAVAQRRGVHCVREKGSRICRVDASARQRKLYAPNARFGKTKTWSSKSCQPGTRPDGRWYLVKCKTGLCKARCRVVRRG